LVASACEQFLVASVQAFHAFVFALLTIPESISSATSLGDLAWDQLSSPGPRVPAGDLTFRLIRIWMNHLVEVELPRVRSLATRFDWESALSLRSLEWRRTTLAKTAFGRSGLGTLGRIDGPTLWESSGWHRDRDRDFSSAPRRSKSDDSPALGTACCYG